MRNVTPVTRGGSGPADAGDVRETSPCPSSKGDRHGAATPRDVCRHLGLCGDTARSPQSATTSRRRDRLTQGGRRHDRGLVVGRAVWDKIACFGTSRLPILIGPWAFVTSRSLWHWGQTHIAILPLRQRYLCPKRGR